MTNLQTRVLVAAIGIPVVLLLTLAGGYYFLAFVAAAALGGQREFYRLAERKGIHPQIGPGISCGLVIVALFAFARIRSTILSHLLARGIAIPFPSMTQSLLIVMLVAVPLFLLVELFRNRGSPLSNLSATLFGVWYVAFFLGTLVGIRELFLPEDFPVFSHFHLAGASVPQEVAETIYRWGGYTLVALFASVWMCDSAAYFVGRAWGRHALFRRVSPNKTWEGSAAGFVFAVLTFVAAKEIALPYLTALQAAVCGGIVGVFGQMGDLAESLLKRDAGVKDSSSLIPGHGGVLDRFDSLMFAAPLVYLYLDFIVF